MQVHGKVAVVTGAASGLGLATCAALSSAGAEVFATDVNLSNLEKAVAPLLPDQLLPLHSFGDAFAKIGGDLRVIERTLHTCAAPHRTMDRRAASLRGLRRLVFFRGIRCAQLQAAR